MCITVEGLGERRAACRVRQPLKGIRVVLVAETRLRFRIRIGVTAAESMSH